MKRIFAIFFLFLCLHAKTQVEYGRFVCKTLSDSAFHGRGYIKGGDSLAANWIANEFKKIGLKPLKKSFFQSFSFPVNTFPSDIHLSINGRELILGKEYIPNEASGSFTGDWIFRKLFVQDLYSAKTISDVKDSLVQKKYNSLVFFKGNATGDSLKKYHEVIHYMSQFGSVLSVVKDKLTFSVADAQTPFAYFTVIDSVLPAKIQTIHSEINPVLVPKHLTQNVLAFLPAKKKKAPYLFFTAHYDHLGAIGNQVYFPGASDNASGVAMLLSLADYFKKNPSSFNLVFVAFAGEEAGLIGSNFYVNHPLVPLDKMRFLVNLDLMGNGEDGATIVNGSVFKEEFELLQTINKENNYLPVLKVRGKAANSDHYHFSEKGVPAFFMYTMGKNKNYHDIFDKYEELSFAKFNEIIRLWIDFSNKLHQTGYNTAQ